MMAQTRRSKAILVTLAAAAGAVAVLAGMARRSIRASGTQDFARKLTVPVDPAPTDLGGPPRMMLAADTLPAGDETAPEVGTGVADAGPSEAELQLLRDRVAVLEQQLAQKRTDSRADSRTELLQDVDDQVARAREQLARQQKLRQAQAAEAQERRAERDEAIDALLEVERRLATGDSEVVDLLDGVSPALPLPAQRALETARAAIDQEDLFAARYWISVAIAQAERTELGR